MMKKMIIKVLLTVSVASVALIVYLARKHKK